MATHPDAVGYLSDLASEIGKPWFHMLCDLSVAGGASTLDNATAQRLCAVYLGVEDYRPLGAQPAPHQPNRQAPQTDQLAELSEFSNFKRLSDTLELRFSKQITLIFGTNSSGKSSICEALRILALPDPSNRPVENARESQSAPPQFRFKFASDSVPQTWTPAVGYGTRQPIVRLFDTSIASSNVTKAIDPRRVVILTPFRLNVFDSVKKLAEEFRRAIEKLQQENSEKLGKALESIRGKFAPFKAEYLSSIDESTASALSAEIESGENFSDQALMKEKLSQADDLRKATSDEGLKMLRVELRELDAFLKSLNSLLDSSTELFALEPAKIGSKLTAALRERETIASSMVPEGRTLEALLSLIRSASLFCDLEDALGCPCPLCRRELGLQEAELFQRYQKLISDSLSAEIGRRQGELEKAATLAQTVTGVDRGQWKEYATISPETIEAADRSAAIIAAGCNISSAPAEDAKRELKSLKNWTKTIEGSLESKRAAVEAAAGGRAKLLTELSDLEMEIQPLQYKQAIADSLEGLKKARELSEWAQRWEGALREFPPLLKKITDKLKVSHDELVSADFETKLDAEYKALAEKGMAAFGVRLTPKGAEAAVTIIPQIGGRPIAAILSEGEQRLHALALFFAELETSAHSVVVFDDPVSSFDYNFISTYCTRLRDFALRYPGRQIIVLTHAWHFFVQLQLTLNKANLPPRMSVQVLENCSIIAEYSEKIDDLKDEIARILSSPGEPDSKGKEELAGKMRRLIEAIVNTHVFCNLRHQFRERSQAVSEFEKCTKLVALLQQEALSLTDLFSKLSPPEHYDPRNAFTTVDKAAFQTRYNEILKIEMEVVARRP
jgi:recombinational DNA repair ATPase RecF